MAKHYFCDNISSVHGARALMLERKLLPFVKNLLYHKIILEDDIEDLVGIIHSEQQLTRVQYPRLRQLDITVTDSSLPDSACKFIKFGDCYARLVPVLGYAGMDVEVVSDFKIRPHV